MNQISILFYLGGGGGGGRLDTKYMISHLGLTIISLRKGPYLWDGTGGGGLLFPGPVDVLGRDSPDGKALGGGNSVLKVKRPSVSVAAAVVEGRPPVIDASEVPLGATGGGGPLDGGAGGGGREASGLDGFGPNGDRTAGGLGALLGLAAGIGGGAMGLAAVTGGGGGGIGVFLEEGNPPGMTLGGAGGGIGGPFVSLRGTGGEFLLSGIGGPGGGGGGTLPEL